MSHGLTSPVTRRRSHNDSSIFVGVSGGHTESRAIAVCDSHVVGRASAECLNYHAHEYRTVGETAEKLLNGLAKSISCTRWARYQISDARELARYINRITVALPGVTSQLDHDLGMATLLSGPKERLTIVDDTWAGLVAETLGSVGMAVVAGTGASVFLGLGNFRLGKEHKFDGNGPIIGDWGSGFRLANRYIEQVLRSQDRREAAPLFDTLKCKLNDIYQFGRGVQSAEDIQNWFDSLCRTEQFDWKSRFAKIAAVITSDADSVAPTELATSLVRASADELLGTIGIAFKHLDLLHQYEKAPDPRTLDVICRGGQFQHSRLFFKTVQDGVQAMCRSNTVRMGGRGLEFGALLMALGDGLNPCSAAKAREILSDLEDVDGVE